MLDKQWITPCSALWNRWKTWWKWNNSINPAPQYPKHVISCKVMGETHVPLSVMLRGTSLTITQIYMTNLYISIYGCVYKNIIYPLHFWKILPFSPPWDFRYCSKGMLEKKMVSCGGNGFNGLCSRKNKCGAAAQAGALSQGTGPAPVGSPGHCLRL